MLFSTDLAIIRNSNAHSVIAVYLLTSQASIIQSIINISSVPVFAGVGGGTTTELRSVNLAFQAEQMGAYGVVVNAPMKNEVIKEIRENIDIPLIATISSFADDFVGKIEAGANAITYTPPSSTEIFATLMKKYRGEENE